MVEIELQEKLKIKRHVVTDAEEQKSIPSSQKHSGGKSIPAEEPTEHKQGNSEDNTESRLVPSTTPNTELQIGDVFYGSVNHKNKSGNNTVSHGLFLVTSVESRGKRNQSREYKLMPINSNEFKACSGGIKIHNIESEKKQKQIEKRAKEAFGDKEEAKKVAKEIEEEKKQEEKIKKISYNFSSLTPKQKLFNLIKAGMNNIWMVGPAGCGKSTIARETAKELDMPYLCISCGIGTSATEFTGYKYPTREATKFSEYYAKKSVILIDEMTALDPAVAQVINAALANNEIETTTGTVTRHPECIIIATSNTFGGGADRQYVANNQLDASTIDRFIGGIIEVNYSAEYENTYDKEVVTYINLLRECIKLNSLRRIASTRMIQAGSKMKLSGIKDWKDLLIINWTDVEKKIVTEYVEKHIVNKLKDAIESKFNSKTFGLSTAKWAA